MLKSLKLRKKKKKIVYSFYHASSLTYDQLLFKLIIYIIKFIHHSLSTALAIVQNTIFTFMLDDEELEKYIFVTIMNEKILKCFIILLQIIDREGSYMTYIIIYLFLNVTIV